MAQEPYHHGDLRAALVDAVLDAARDDGVGSLSLREITRRVGVAPSAAYRHFPDFRALTVAAALVAQERLAASMREEIASLAAHDADGTRSPAQIATDRLRGVGLGYIRFALSEPGWFELALLTFDPGASDLPTVTVDHGVPEPFRLLLEALDGCVEAGALTAAEREHAEWPCWSAVHGFADIAARGPLRGQEPDMLAGLGAHVVERAVAGLSRRG